MSKGKYKNVKYFLKFIAALFLFAPTSIEKTAYAGGTRFPTENSIIYDARFSPHGELLFVADGQQVKAFNFADGQTLRVFGNGHDDQIMSLAVSADSTLLASGDRSGLLILHDLQTGHVIQSLLHHEGLIMALDISSNSKHMASAATDNKVLVYNLETAKMVKTFNEHEDDVLAVSFSPDGKWLVSAAADGMIVVIDIEKLDVHQIITSHEAFLWDVQFAPDSKSFISVGDDGRYVRHKLNETGFFIEAESSKMSRHWITSIDHGGGEDTFVMADARGRVVLKTLISRVTASFGVPVNRILYYPAKDHTIQLVAATRGKGILYMHGSDMRFRAN